jgi:hypothetical protein
MLAGTALLQRIIQTGNSTAVSRHKWLRTSVHPLLCKQCASYSYHALIMMELILLTSASTYLLPTQTHFAVIQFDIAQGWLQLIFNNSHAEAVRVAAKELVSSKAMCRLDDAKQLH